MTVCKTVGPSVGRGIARACVVAALAAMLLVPDSGWAGSQSSGQALPDDYVPELVLVPAGEMAVLDSDRRSGQDRENEPRHVVFERSFLIGKFEVTFDQWDYCHRSGGCAHRPRDKGWGRADRPVIDVSWDEVIEYLDWLSAATGERYRLPTEDEWEYAARAGAAQPAEPPPLFTDEALAWAADYSLAPRQSKKTKPVGSGDDNPFGLFGTRDNVWEWTDSCWQQTYETDDGRVFRENCGLRVVQGEHRSHMPSFIRETSTGGCSIKPLPGNFGFRVVRES